MEEHGRLFAVKRVKIPVRNLLSGSVTSLNFRISVFEIRKMRHLSRIGGQ